MGGMVTIFDPQGNKGEIPFENLTAAVKAGAKPAITVKAPNGSIGDIPADRLPDAAKAGASVVPLKDQETQHPGFWARAADLMGGLLHPSGFSPYPGMDQEAKSQAAAQSSELNQSEKAAGYSAPYRALVPAARSVGVDVPGMEQSAREGDVGGVAAAAAVPIATLAAAEGVRHGAPTAAEAASKYGVPIARALGTTIDAASFDRISKIWNAWKTLPEEIRARGPQFQNPGAPLPEKPPTELLQARGLAQGAVSPADPAAGLGRLPVEAQTPPTYPGGSLPARPSAELLQAQTLARGGAAPPPEPAAALEQIPARPASLTATIAPAPEAATPQPMSVTPNGNTIPRTLSGDSALRQVLTGQDNANLLKIAKSRGLNVTRESQLKPGTADNLLVNKIVNDFSPDELSEISAQYLENNRFRHAFGDIGPEAWKTMSLQTYFPEMKIPLAQLLRSRKAITTAGAQKFAPVTDLAETLKSNAKASAAAQPPAAAPEASDDLTQILQESLKRARASQ